MVPQQKRRILYVTLGFIAAACSLLMAQTAQTSKPKQTQLYSQATWFGLCNKHKGNDLQYMRCQQLASGAAHLGRGASNFDIVRSNDPWLVVSRSGVFFDPQVNNSIVSVEDFGNGTTMQMKNGLTCAAWATPADVAESPLTERSILVSFVRNYGINASQPDIAVENSEADQLDFALEGLRGTYIVDRHLNTAIWAACKGQDDAVVEVGATKFFDMIKGASRRY